MHDNTLKRNLKLRVSTSLTERIRSLLEHLVSDASKAGTLGLVRSAPGLWGGISGSAPSRGCQLWDRHSTHGLVSVLGFTAAGLGKCVPSAAVKILKPEQELSTPSTPTPRGRGRRQLSAATLHRQALHGQ